LILKSQDAIELFRPDSYILYFVSGFQHTGINVKMRKSITMMQSPSKTMAQFASVRDIYKTPSYPKSPLEYEFIKMALLENVMFSSLPEDSLDCLVDAFEVAIATKDAVIVTQGELRQLRGKRSSNLEGDYVYSVGDGQCTVLVDDKVVPEPYGTLKPKAVFGELAVLYRQSRAATITAKTDTVALYRVKGDAFKSILNHHQTTKDDPELLEKIDNVINQIAGTKSLYGGVIIRQYKSPRLWLWTRWTGTVFQHNYKTVMGMMMFSLVLMVGIQYFTESDGKFALLPDQSYPVIEHLEVIAKLWSYQATL
jgi:CRP-like cAMP-binding protein